MILDIAQLVLLGILCASVHWLIARSEIFRPFWSRTRGWLASLLACAGCSGFWLGAICGVTNIAVPVGFSAANGPTWLGLGLLIAQTFITGVIGVFVTPIFGGLLLWGLETSALRVDGDDDEAPEPASDTGSVPEPVLTSDSALVTPVDNPIRRKKTS